MCLQGRRCNKRINLFDYTYESKKPAHDVLAFYDDPDRTRTCDTLIRSEKEILSMKQLLLALSQLPFRRTVLATFTAHGSPVSELAVGNVPCYTHLFPFAM